MANIFELASKDGNIKPEKARKSRQNSVCLGSSLSMRSFAIDEPGSSVRALHATLADRNSHMRSTALKAETNCQQFSLLKQAQDSFDNCLQAVHTFDSFCKILKFIMNISITKRIWKKLRLLPSGVCTFAAHFLPYLLFFCN